MDLKNILQSKAFTLITWSIAVLVLTLAVLQLGIIIGEKKSEFSHRWSDNYHRNFGGPKAGFENFFGDQRLMEANGTFGQLIKIEGQNLTIKDGNNTEKSIVIGSQTAIKRFQNDIKPEELTLNDYLVAIGQPNNQGQIEAKLIRLLPPPPPFGNNR